MVSIVRVVASLEHHVHSICGQCCDDILTCFLNPVPFVPTVCAFDELLVCQLCVPFLQVNPAWFMDMAPAKSHASGRQRTSCEATMSHACLCHPFVCHIPHLSSIVYPHPSSIVHPYPLISSSHLFHIYCYFESSVFVEPSTPTLIHVPHSHVYNCCVYSF